MKFSYATLALLFSTVIASPIANNDEVDDNGRAVSLSASVFDDDDYIGAGVTIDDDGNVSVNATVDYNQFDKRAPNPPFIKIIINWHNAYRAHHGVPGLTWNTALSNFAARSAKRCIFAHTANNQYGENIAAGTYTNPAYYIYLWYNEVKKYNFNNPGFADQTGHFTQVVWKSTTQVGCAWVKCPGSLSRFLFCEYSPRGNVLPASNFKANVLPAKSSPALPPVPAYNQAGY